MKRFLLFLTGFLFVTIIMFGQFQLTGKVYDQEGISLPGAIIVLNNGKYYYATDEFGRYQFKNLPAGTYDIKITHVGYDDSLKTIKLTESINLDFMLNNDNVNELEKVIVNSTRVMSKTPIAFITVQKNQIERMNHGQDIPYVLKHTPSMVVNSDAGTGIGYTQMRIRGVDGSGINMTVNGIPLNDPESHGLFLVNLPDFTSSTDNIQIQRGVGSSTNGAGAFGATINLKTNKLNSLPYAEVSTGYGSFNTFKNNIKFGTGIISKHFAFDGRLSKISSDGYIDRAWSDLKSFYTSASYFNKTTLLKLTIFSGLEKTYQSWEGVPKDSLQTNRTYNPYTYENEIDHYNQTHYQFFIIKELSENLHLELSTYHVNGKGYYEQYKESESFSDYGFSNVITENDTIYETDLIRRKWLDNDFYGINYNILYSNEKLNLVAGGGWSKYNGYHFGDVIWMQFAGNNPINKEWYRSLGTKSDLNSYLKINYNPVDLFNFFVDLQYRVLNYTITGIDDDLSSLNLKKPYNFFNPKGGVTYIINKNVNFYTSVSYANREPKRSDFIDAPIDKQPKHETLYDYEAGFNYDNKNFAFSINAYYMIYDNQLIMTGKINDVGAPIVENYDNSFRRGLEFSVGSYFFKIIDWNANISLSQNKITNFTEYVDNWDYWNDPDNQPLQISNFLGTTDIAFSPSIVANNTIYVKMTKNFSFEFNSQYVGRQFIDNTSSVDRSLKPYFTNDFGFRSSFTTKTIKEILFTLKVNNVFNQMYETNAWVYSYYYENQRSELNGYFPQAGINFFANLSFKF